MENSYKFNNRRRLQYKMKRKKKLYIVGAGSFGRELESWLHFIPEEKRDWEFKGYLDSVQGKGKLPYPSDFEILGDEKTYPLKKEDYILISIANSIVREKIYKSLKGKVTFFTFISPQAIIGKFNYIDEGSIICPNVIITTNVKLGKCCIVNIGSQIGHDVKVGDFTSLMANVDIAGKCVIGERCFIGTNSTLIPERIIADDITIGAGAIVIRNFNKEKNTIFGNPAKNIYSR